MGNSTFIYQFSCPGQDRHKNMAGLHKFIPFQPSHLHQNILLYFTTKFQMAQMTHFSILHSGVSFLRDGPIKALSKIGGMGDCQSLNFLFITLKVFMFKTEHAIILFIMQSYYLSCNHINCY
jgi:hypothetical protein